MSRGAGYLDQVVELDFQYPSEGIHKRWDGGYRITALASTPDQVGSWRACPLRRRCVNTGHAGHASVPRARYRAPAALCVCSSSHQCVLEEHVSQASQLPACHHEWRASFGRVPCDPPAVGVCAVHPASRDVG